MQGSSTQTTWGEWAVGITLVAVILWASEPLRMMVVGWVLVGAGLIGWAAVMIPVMLLWCAVIAAVVWVLGKLGRLLRIID